MWIGGQRGVIRVSPEPWPDPVSPPVHIERVRLDGDTIAADGHCELMSGARRLAIDFAAPTFADPRNVRLRYRLDGYDEDWIDAGNERIAYYTDLRPGEYTFRVIAQNEDSPPEEERINVAVKPKWWETASFRALAAIGFVFYLILKIISPGTARRVRETIRREAPESS